jgi:Leu/Phe-tRNA-protein transferase
MLAQYAWSCAQRTDLESATWIARVVGRFMHVLHKRGIAERLWCAERKF